MKNFFKHIKENKEYCVVGIDLGTTNSVVSYITDDFKLNVLNNSDNEEKTLSFIYPIYDNDTILHNIEINLNKKTSKFLVGKNAKTLIQEDKLVASSYKKFVGENIKAFKDSANEFYTAHELQTINLAYLRKVVIDNLKTENICALITVPAAFKEHQKREVVKSAKRAGFSYVNLSQEPTASALWFMHLKKLLEIQNNSEEDLEKRFSKLERETKNVLVYDLGGGTFDTAILEIKGFSTAEVRGQSGNPKLGGDDIDDIILNMIINKDKSLKRQLSKSAKRELWAKLKELSEIIKIKMSDRKFIENGIDIDLSSMGEISKVNLTFDEIYSSVENLISRSFSDVETALEQFNIQYNQRKSRLSKGFKPNPNLKTLDNIDQIILAGGSSKSYMVKMFWAKYIMNSDLSKDKKILFLNDIKSGLVDPDLAISLGASVNALAIYNIVSGMTIVNKTIANYGIEVGKNRKFSCLITSDTPIGSNPIINTKLYNVPKGFSKKDDSYIRIHIHEVPKIINDNVDDSTILGEIQISKEFLQSVYQEINVDGKIFSISFEITNDMVMESTIKIEDRVFSIPIKDVADKTVNIEEFQEITKNKEEKIEQLVDDFFS